MLTLVIRKYTTLLHEKGIVGLQKLIDQGQKKNYFYKTICLLDDYYIGAQKLISFLEKLNNDLPQKGLAKVSTEFLDKLRIKVVRDERVDARLNQPQKAILFVGINHDLIIEPVILASFLKREFFLISHPLYRVLGKNFRRFLLPVWQKRYAINWHNSFQKKIENFFNPLYEFYLQENLTMEEIEKFNNKTFSEAASKLTRGKNILIFPGGAGTSKNKWRRGIGEIMIKVPPAKRKNIYVMALLFSGVQKKEVFRNLRLAFTNQKVPTIKINVTLIKYLNLDKFLSAVGGTSNPNLITQKLEAQCNSQISH